MILDNSGNQAVSHQLMKQAGVLTIGQQIFVQAIAQLIANGRIVTENLLTETATEAVQAAAVYLALAEHSMKPGTK